VRLRVDEAAQKHSPRRKSSGVLVLHQPASSDAEPPSAEQAPLVPADQYNYEALRPGELPVVELVPLSELPRSRPPARLWRWVLLLTTLAVVTGSIVALIFLLGR
jgi:hypothetical protein